MGPTAAYVSKNIFFKLFKKQINNIYPKLKIEDDNPRQFDQVMCRSACVKNAKFFWTRIAIFSSLPTFSRSVRTLLTQGVPILFMYGLLGSLEHARLTAIKSAFGLDSIQSTPLCQNKFGPRKSNLQP